MADKGLVFTVDGVRHELNTDEITGRDAKAFRDATGMAFRRAMSVFIDQPDDIDIDSIAGIVWLARRQAGESVTYDDVLGSINYSSNFATAVAEVDAPQL